jgi:flap endonuclease-1
MGLQISEIVPRKDIEISDLKGKIIAVDAFNIIYQFLSSIRQPDGTPLQDSKGRITSHLSGLFYRNISLLNQGLKLIYVFDGIPPKMKEETQEKRREAKGIAKEKYEAAIEKEDVEEMGKYARQLTGLDKEKIEQSKKLLKAMGIAVIQAKGEGEAQASYMCNKGDAYAVASQDYDCLMFEAPRLIQNLTLANRRRVRGGWQEVKPQLIDLSEVRKELGINQEQLISIGVLSGTDYNPKGVLGIGQKKALGLVQKYKKIEKIFGAEELKGRIDFSWKKVFNLINEPRVDKNYKEKIKFGKFDFNEVKKQFEKIREVQDQQKQRTLF